jgi:hypothetical protein
MRQQILATLISMAFSGTAWAQATGPSSSASPYVTSTATGWSVTSILTVGDSVNNKPDGTAYRMVGIPDGLGAYSNNNGTFTVLMNHEIGATSGIARAHGATGGFVSEWVIRSSDLKVLNGADLATSHLVSSGTGAWAPATGTANSFGRLCSADLAAESAFYNPLTGRGTQSRIFMNGEEVGVEGRAYGFVATGSSKGTAYELPKLGKFSWENSVANPYTGDRTVVVGMDDSTPGQVYIYSGTKQYTGNDVQRAGLDNGTLRGIKVNAAAAQGGANGNLENAPINGSFSTVVVDTSVNGAAQQANSAAAKITEFARPEDGHWADAKTFYFVTTGATLASGAANANVTNTARLYRLTFADGAGGAVDYDNGSLSMVLDSASLNGSDGATARSFDNITVAKNGEVLIQEDPGNNSYVAKTWIFDPRTGQTKQILESDRNRFVTGAAGFLTQDEESSGVIDVTDALGRNDGNRYFLGVMQAHYSITGELVEGGQMYLVTQAIPEPQTYAMWLGGLGLVGFLASRRRRTR